MYFTQNFKLRQNLLQLKRTFVAYKIIELLQPTFLKTYLIYTSTYTKYTATRIIKIFMLVMSKPSLKTLQIFAPTDSNFSKIIYESL